MELQIIQQKIFEIRGYRVMLDFDLASLYQVPTKVLKQAVKRNINRFPVPDFMFELSDFEWNELVTNCDQFPKSMKHSSVAPTAFSEHGILMISSVLRSEVAVQMNIAIMRAFVAMRQMITGYDELLRRIEELEISTDEQFNELYKALTALLADAEERRRPRNPVGYINYERKETEVEK